MTEESEFFYCPDCGNEISKKAKTCPYCGRPITSKDFPHSKMTLGALIGISFVIFFCFFNVGLIISFFTGEAITFLAMMFIAIILIILLSQKYLQD
jgi:uncharacterized membrane protein YvbJ